MVNLFVEPTNNNAERALRELIVQRKIIGGLRREKGARIMEVITSVIATLKKEKCLCSPQLSLIYRVLAITFIYKKK